jgi:hypothetical protein
MLPSVFLLASMLAGQAQEPPAPTPPTASASEPPSSSEAPEPEIVTLATTPAPTPISKPLAIAPPAATPSAPRPTATATPLRTAPVKATPVAAAPVKAAPVKAAPAPAAPKPAPSASAAAGAGRIPVLKTRDWAGKAPVYAIHFSSFQKRDNAARDAADLEKRLKLPGRAVEINLGAKGTWYRAMIGEFPTAEDARRAVAALPADLAHDVGFVYRLQAP